MRGIVLSFVLVTAGCGGHSNVQLTSSGSPSTGVSTGGSVNVQGRSTLGVLIAIGVLVGASHGSDRQYEMDDTRIVNEQDCTKPVEDRSANLKCR